MIVSVLTAVFIVIGTIVTPAWADAYAEHGEDGSLRIDTDGTPVTLSMEAGSDAILVDGLPVFTGAGDYASLANTSSVFIAIHEPGRVTLDLTGGHLQDAGGADLPIDIVNFSFGWARLTVTGTSGDDVMHLTRDSWTATLDLDGDGVEELSTRLEEIRIKGRQGNDSLSATADAIEPNLLYVFNGGQGDDALVGSDGADTLLGGPGNDFLSGGSESDYIEGGKGLDTIEGGEGSDIIGGGGDGDVITAGSGNDWVYDSSGHDQINTDEGNDQVYDWSGDDHIITSDGDDSVHDFNGDDIVAAGDGDDSIFGGNGEDMLEGWLGMDTIYAAAGNDEVTGGAGNDMLFGGQGDDFIMGSDNYTDGPDDGDDVIVGNAGNDAVLAGWGDDTIIGGNISGPDNASASNDDYLMGESGDDFIAGGRGRDIIDGLDGNDQLQGDQDDDSVAGSRGDDLVIGGQGDDFLTGYEGDDIFPMGATIDGADQVSGGPGEDTVDYLSRRDAASVTLDNQANDGVAGENDNIVEDIEVVRRWELAFKDARGNGLVLISPSSTQWRLHRGGANSGTITDTGMLALPSGGYAIDYSGDQVTMTGAFSSQGPFTATGTLNGQRYALAGPDPRP
jgi:Ca2+-binding RTX toxin-like protein